MATAEDTAFLTMAYARLRAALQSHPGATLPSPSALQTALSSLPTSCSSLPAHGPEATLDHLLTDLLPACDGHALSGRYYGFVTGGCHPVAEAADNMVSALDQNVQVHLPAQYAATAVEDAALRMVVSLLGLGDADADWPGRTFTTGATASNVLGLLCGREAVVRRRLMEGRGAVGEEELRRHSVAEAGLLGACAAAGIKEIQVITSMGHSSLSKAASIAGLGHAAVKQLAASAEEPWRLSMDAVERELKRADDGFVSIIALSAGEVNTGRFATAASDLPKLRRLADKYGAWIHVDGGGSLRPFDKIPIDV